jgi:hypothetical protein
MVQLSERRPLRELSEAVFHVERTIFVFHVKHGFLGIGNLTLTVHMVPRETGFSSWNGCYTCEERFLDCASRPSRRAGLKKKKRRLASRNDRFLICGLVCTQDYKVKGRKSKRG